MSSLHLEDIHLQIFILDVSAILKYDSQFHTCLVNQNKHNSELDNNRVSPKLKTRRMPQKINLKLIIKNEKHIFHN